VAVKVGWLDFDKSIYDTTKLFEPVKVVLGVLHSSYIGDITFRWAHNTEFTLTAIFALALNPPPLI